MYHSDRLVPVHIIVPGLLVIVPGGDTREARPGTALLACSLGKLPAV